MKYTKCLFGLPVLSLTLAVSCKPDADHTTETAAETSRQEMAHPEAVNGNTSQDWEAYTHAQKTRFITSMEAELAAINRSIDDLAARVAQLETEAKSDATPRVNELRNQADLLEAHLGDIKDSTASTWDEVKATTRETHEHLKQNLSVARRWVSNKIEP